MSDETDTSATPPDIAASVPAAPASVVAVHDVVARALAIELNESDHDAYNALNDGAAFFDLAPRHISVFTGEKAGDALNGLVSNDVLPLSVGKGLYAAALTPKGKMLADVSILRTDPQSYLVETSEAAGREWWSMIRKYVNPRLAKYKDESDDHATIGVYGPNAPAIIARLGTGGLGDQTITDAMEEGLRAWPNWAHSTFALSGINVRLVRAPYLGTLPGFEILASKAARRDLLKNLARVGAIAGNSNVWQLAAIEGGRPVLGLDMDANTIPQEANLDDWAAISYEKGCYTGQETVARIHFRGHVNKHLRGLSSGALLQPGSSVHDLTGKAVGEVRRSGVSPRLGPIAIALIRREVAVGAEVRVGPDGAAESARVTTLPMAADRPNKKRGAS
ncbi:MAG: glycine cleavage T C-terminal barrel domain-containing protein [Gemmatimonas sp.]